MTEAKKKPAKKEVAKSNKDKIQERVTTVVDDLKQKFGSKTLVIVGAVVAAILLLMIIGLAGGKESPDKVAAKYCSIMEKGNYGDLLDLADLPDSPFFSKEKIAKAKPEYREYMESDNNSVTSCKYIKADETDDLIIYKLTLNNDKTDTLKVKKSNSKITTLEGVYDVAKIAADKGAVVTVDGVVLTDSYERSNYLIYNVAILKRVEYHAKATSMLLNDVERDFHWSGATEISLRMNAKKDDFKNPAEYDTMIKLLEETLPEIVKEAAKTGNVSSYNKYFVNSNANEIVKASELYKSINKERIRQVGFSTQKAVFEKWTDVRVPSEQELVYSGLGYIGDNRFKFRGISMYYDLVVTSTTTTLKGETVQSVLDKRNEEDVSFSSIIVEWTTDGWKIREIENVFIP